MLLTNRACRLCFAAAEQPAKEESALHGAVVVGWVQGGLSNSIQQERHEGICRPAGSGRYAGWCRGKSHTPSYNHMCTITACEQQGPNELMHEMPSKE